LLWFSAPVAWAGDDAARVVTALSAREPTESCAQLVAALPDPVATLRQVVETHDAPAWLPVRAASCLATVPHAEPTLRLWVAREGWGGIADAVLARLDELPRAVALDLAKVALAGPNRELARARLKASAVPELSALARP
jgi:hypothetical protein